MDLNSTHFISYHSIKVEDVDLIEDAWGFNNEFYDVVAVLRKVRFEPGGVVTENLISKIRQKNS